LALLAGEAVTLIQGLAGVCRRPFIAPINKKAGAVFKLAGNDGFRQGKQSHHGKNVLPAVREVNTLYRYFFT
jgi:hypothetical protein